MCVCCRPQSTLYAQKVCGIACLAFRPRSRPWNCFPDGRGRGQIRDELAGQLAGSLVVFVVNDVGQGEHADQLGGLDRPIDTELGSLHEGDG